MPTVITTARGFPGEIKRLHERIARKIVVATHEIAHRGLAEAVRITNTEHIIDQSAYKRAFRVDDSQRRRSTDGQRDMRFRKMPAMLINDAPHAAVIEHGRRKGAKMPPDDAIRGWVRRKLGIGDSDPKQDRVVFAVRKAIAKRGLKPKKVMFRAYLKMRSWWQPRYLAILRTTT